MGLFSLASKKIWIASSYFTEDKKIVEKMVKFGAGGIVLKSALHLGSPCKRDCPQCQSPDVYLRKKRLLVDPETKGFTYYTFHENQFCEYLFSSEVVEILVFLKKKYPHVFRVANIISKTQKDVLKMARLFEKKGAQAIEFNGLKYLERGRVSQKMTKIDFLCLILKKLRKTVNLPIYIKLWPAVLSEKNFKKLSRWTEGITLTNSFLTKKMSRQLKKSIKKNRQKEEVEMAVHGEPLWPYVKKYLPLAKKYFLQVSVCGGITTIDRVKKAFALGADSVQLCSGIELNGPRFIKEAQSVFG